ncbi:kinesin-like protein KIN-7I isoform X1 [Musa acuminata AAA Group]|uniref:kinesin-like protein KIN-7I isoform X1 n=1 Tax=Musa acuminata AAA Group TaxID=214697 RepID=UPI0031DFBF0C
MERIYVAVRARPLSPEESKSNPWRISGNSIYLPSQSTKFEFDRIFGEDCKTVDVYEARTKEIVASAVSGFNGTVFAYGQTNSGKTHTMRGSAAEPGIIPLAVHDLFLSIQEDIDREFLVRMSYMEIYNEEINDLLAPEHRKLQIHENLERGIYVAGLREEIVTCAEQVLDLMEFGESHRHIGETNMNLHSSRSHTIFRMIVESRERIEDGNMVDSCDAVRVSVLNLVDLAGSERAAKTGAEGMRLKEGSHINKSLMTLGTVIKKLSEGAEGQGIHVPYRDSKLTRILQPALGGNANTAIICNITLAQVHADETKSSLQFSSRALRVTNCACVNEILTDAALLRRQRKEIEELRSKLLSSHSEHWEEEILNLRNTLLQSELEKERIQLELEEEKKAKAHREKRLIEQAQKIANLSSLVLCSEREDKSTYLSKNKRRVTWCPVPSSRKCVDEVHVPDSAAGEHTRHDSDIGLPIPFEELMQEIETSVGNMNRDAFMPDNMENGCDVKDLTFPDAHALLHVTDRRKIHSKTTGSFRSGSESAEDSSFYEDQIIEYYPKNVLEIESGSIHNKFSDNTPRCASTISSNGEINGRSCGRKSLTERESEAIIVIKQLEDQIKALEIEKATVQRNLDDVLDMATEQNASFKEKYEKLHQEVLLAREEARVSHERLYPAEVKFDLSVRMSMEVQDLTVQVEHSKNFVDNTVSIIKDIFNNYSVLADIFLELKSFAQEDISQLKSIITGLSQMERCIVKRSYELEQENNILRKQSVDYQSQVQQLMAEVGNREKAINELGLQHDLEKDELLSQVLSLKKEVSCLSSSSLIREKETMRKELDKLKAKLKDTDSKLKNAVQDKIKLESEKAQAEREIKRLQSQNVVLERDMWKRDSLTVRRHEPKLGDFSRQKSVNVVEQTLQEDYQKLELCAFDMEAEISSLKEALISAFGEKEEALARNEFLNSEVEALSDKLLTADSEIKSLKEEVAAMAERLVESESFSKELESSINSLSREKEEMGLQFTDALLEMEAEKSIWSVNKKALFEANAKMKIQNDEILKLSEDLLETKRDMDSYREQCKELRERLIFLEENAQEEKECSMAKSLEITQLRNELKQNMADIVEWNDVKSSFEALSSECQHTSEILPKLWEYLIFLSREGNDPSSQVMNGDQELTLKAKTDSDELAKRISNMEVKIHSDNLSFNKERTKLRMQLRSLQATLDAYRGRYTEVVDEMTLMNKKYEEASTKLKKQLAQYGVEILSLKKQLASKE